MHFHVVALDMACGKLVTLLRLPARKEHLACVMLDGELMRAGGKQMNSFAGRPTSVVMLQESQQWLHQWY
jgi:hypothetical protein